MHLTILHFILPAYKKSNAYALLLVVFIVGRMSILSFEISFSTLIHLSCIPYFRFRAIKWIGVPSKTKALRIWFSKKRR